VLLSGGVGLTPMVSTSRAGRRAADLVRPRRAHGRAHAMGRRVRDLAAQARNMTVRSYYETPAAADAIGRDYDEDGFIDLEWLADAHAAAGATYYLCGPRPFLRAFVSGLARRGVPLHPLRVLRAGGFWPYEHIAAEGNSRMVPRLQAALDCERRSLRAIYALLAEAGHLNEHGPPFNRRSIKAVVQSYALTNRSVPDSKVSARQADHHEFLLRLPLWIAYVDGRQEGASRAG
jgi:hypothetical protein